MTAEEIELIKRMAEDAARNGDHQGASSLHALLAEETR